MKYLETTVKRSSVSVFSGLIMAHIVPNHKCSSALLQEVLWSCIAKTQPVHVNCFVTSNWLNDDDGKPLLDPQHVKQYLIIATHYIKCCLDNTKTGSKRN